MRFSGAQAIWLGSAVIEAYRGIKKKKTGQIAIYSAIGGIGF